MPKWFILIQRLVHILARPDWIVLFSVLCKQLIWKLLSSTKVAIRLGKFAHQTLRTFHSSWSTLRDVVSVHSSFPDGGVHADVQQAQAEHLESAAGCAAVHEGLLPGVRIMFFLCEVPLQSVLRAFVASILPVVFVSDCCCSRKAARTWTCSLGSSQRPVLLLPTPSVRPSRFHTITVVHWQIGLICCSTNMSICPCFLSRKQKLLLCEDWGLVPCGCNCEENWRLVVLDLLLTVDLHTHTLKSSWMGYFVLKSSQFCYTLLGFDRKFWHNIFVLVHFIFNKQKVCVYP